MKPFIILGLVAIWLAVMVGLSLPPSLNESEPPWACFAAFLAWGFTLAILIDWEVERGDHD